MPSNNIELLFTDVCATLNTYHHDVKLWNSGIWLLCLIQFKMFGIPAKLSEILKLILD